LANFSPQQGRPGGLPYAIALISLFLAGCASKTAQTASREQEPPARDVIVDAKTQRQLGVEVQLVSAQSLAAPITATGQLQLNEDRTWRVGSVLSGRIVAVPVHLGDVVQAGQVIAQMHSHEVHDARADHRQAVTELERLKILADQAQRVRDRTKRVFDLKAASREQLEAAETQYRSAQLSIANAQASVDKTEAHITEFLDVPLRDTDSGRGGDDADRVPIKAPAAGTVMEREANAGSVVSAGDPVVTISDLSSLWFIAAVNEADLSHIRRGQAVRIAVRAYSERTFPGHVFQLGERLDPQTRTLQVRVLVSNINGLLKPDMFATAEFTPQSQHAIVHVPESAIQDVGGKSVVFVQTPAGAFVPKEIKTGARVDRQVEIVSGVEPGTPVVVNGALLLKSQLLKNESN
jgi:cobalt-zinc-cadmium efflux system membrane fusion protein